jgi:hypothetical protein
MKRTPIKDPIASVSFIWIDPTGTERAVTGLVGKPYSVGDDQWCCTYLLEGALEQEQDIPGTDSIQALSLALYGLYHDLIRMLGDGGRLLNPKTREPFDLVTLKATFSRSTAQFQAIA